jgi:hypothetical protein
MFSILFFSLAFLLLFYPASTFSLHSLSRHTNVATRYRASLNGESEIIEEISEEIEQRNLRFGGVGR